MEKEVCVSREGGWWAACRKITRKHVIRRVVQQGSLCRSVSFLRQRYKLSPSPSFPGLEEEDCFANGNFLYKREIYVLFLDI